MRSLKNKRRKLIREDLENQLAKYERRIQRLAENAYHIRQLIENLKKISQQKAMEEVKQIEGGQTNAISETGKAEGTVDGTKESQ